MCRNVKCFYKMDPRLRGDDVHKGVGTHSGGDGHFTTVLYDDHLILKHSYAAVRRFGMPC